MEVIALDFPCILTAFVFDFLSRSPNMDSHINVGVTSSFFWMQGSHCLCPTPRFCSCICIHVGPELLYTAIIPICSSRLWIKYCLLQEALLSRHYLPSLLLVCHLPSLAPLPHHVRYVEAAPQAFLSTSATFSLLREICTPCVHDY